MWYFGNGFDRLSLIINSNSLVFLIDTNKQSGPGRGFWPQRWLFSSTYPYSKLLA